MFGMNRFSTLFLALLIASPALYSGFVTEQLDPNTALVRLLIAIPVAALMRSAFLAVTKGYGSSDSRATEPLHADGVIGEPVGRRASDAPEPPALTG
jgi:hypothetical protein